MVSELNFDLRKCDFQHMQILDFLTKYLKWPKKCIFIDKIEIMRPVYVIIGVQNG